MNACYTVVFICCRTEPQTFCCRFASWEEVLAVDYTLTSKVLEMKAIEKVHTGLFLGRGVEVGVFAFPSPLNSLNKQGKIFLYNSTS